MSLMQGQVSRGSGIRGYLLVLVCAVVLYGLSAGPDILWQDSGDAILRAWRGDLRGWLGLALSHPSYYLLAQLAAKLPVGEVAWRVNVFSAACSAVAVANVFLLVYLVTGRASGGVVAALTLGLGHTFWWHASVAEVYALLAVGITTEWLLLLRYLQTGRRRWLALLALAAGFNAANHLLAVFGLVGYVIILVWQTRRRQRGLIDWLTAVGCWLVGFIPMLWLIVAQLRLGESVKAVAGSLLFGSGEQYMPAVLNVGFSINLLAASCKYVLLNFPTPVALLGVVGLVRLRRYQGCPGALYRLLVGLAVAWLVFAVRYRVPDQYAFFYPFYVVFAVLIGAGAAWFFSSGGPGRVAWVVGLALLPVVVYAALPPLAQRLELPLGLGRQIPYRNKYVYFLQPWKTGYDGARRFGLAALAEAGPGGVLLADSTVVPVLRYLQELNGIGRDVYVQTFADHIFYGPLRVDGGNVAQELAAGTFVGICSDSPGYVPGWLYEDVGPPVRWRFDRQRVGVVFRLVPKSQDGGKS